MKKFQIVSRTTTGDKLEFDTQNIFSHNFLVVYSFKLTGLSLHDPFFFMPAPVVSLNLTFQGCFVIHNSASYGMKSILLVV